MSTDLSSTAAAGRAATSRPTTTSPADRFMRRLLRVESQRRPGDVAAAQKAMRTSLLLSTARCLLVYIVLPFVAPALGFAVGVGSGLGVLIAVVALTSITVSMRRFWRADHPKRWHYTAFGGTVAAFLVVSLVIDALDLVSRLG